MVNPINYALAKKDWDKAYDDFDGLQVGGRNYFRPSEVVPMGVRDSSVNGSVIGNDTSLHSFYLEVEEGETYSISRDSMPNNRFDYGFLDAYPEDGLEFIGIGSWNGYRDDLKIEGITVPENAKYLFLYLTNQDDELPNIQIELGNRATDWTPAPEDVGAHPLVARMAEASHRSKANEERIKDLENTITALGGGS